eukprot:CAMPEP_0176297338 /NCGR_PEP_ID=MMETSP0121_2-20121125/58669_1 /TAXON_ID=160619 /ORGANISM="Kryptoperidinium foliaceum, Strain CCMP 1326" /LENGTH=89 /DNA_ID=CAMNT_0017638521 /DNA_START=45 /DNA_END=310 /DNA_ORIENTATION=-
MARRLRAAGLCMASQQRAAGARRHSLLHSGRDPAPERTRRARPGRVCGPSNVACGRRRAATAPPRECEGVIRRSGEVLGTSSRSWGSLA